MSNDFGDPEDIETFTRRFWEQKVAWAQAGDVDEDGHPCLRVEGVHYVILPNVNEPGRFKGFGGRKLVFEKFDGTLIESENVWCQGDIPDDFKDRLPDNARFVPPQVTPTFTWE